MKNENAVMIESDKLDTLEATDGSYYNDWSYLDHINEGTKFGVQMGAAIGVGTTVGIGLTAGIFAAARGISDFVWGETEKPAKPEKTPGRKPKRSKSKRSK